MKEQQPNQILSSIQESYFHQFEQKLDDRLLNYVVEKEIQKKREAFLQVQLATSGLSLEGLNALRKHLQKNMKAKGETAEITPTLSKKADDSSLSKLTTNTNAALALDFNQESEDGEESERLKRRAYARAYYHRKKMESEKFDSAAAKKFKTTPEQRAYQRAYYKRKKSITKQRTRQEELLANSQNRLFAEEASQHLNHEQGHDDKSELALKNTSAHNKGPAVDYEILSADRLAIDNAFRSSGLNPLDFDQAFKQETSGSSSRPFNTKTKLRKAKASF